VSNIRKKFESIAIAILVGGKSTRFGSDKGLFEFLNKPLISYQLETLYQSNYDLFIAAHTKNQVQDYIMKIDLKNIVAFIIDDYELISNLDIYTPMRGLYSVFKELKSLNYKKVLTLACDTPLIQYNVIEFIIEESKGFDCCIPRWNNGFLEPLYAVYHIKKSYLKAKENLIKGDFKLRSLLDKSWSINYISIENQIKPIDQELLTFININKSGDLDKLKAVYFKKSM